MQRRALQCATKAPYVTNIGGAIPPCDISSIPFILQCYIGIGARPGDSIAVLRASVKSQVQFSTLAKT